ncbi:unnamed protein product [Dracunculus medinensis]|uniref:Cysteine-rich with EGF-like domain protein 2 n=1 Tax=Dracunculus medinensis TaxID=318479 RepID=A0A0N4UQB2_DRAME|nr:unnamed protein product [Dracunculus medinensis]
MRRVNAATLSSVQFYLFIYIITANECDYCSLIVKTFQTGLKKTENQHFAGGNTEWEERNLGRFATSETRLIEVMEYVCKTKNAGNVENNDKFAHGIKDVEFKCQQMVEENEENIENWYFHKQNSDPDMHLWLCVEKLQVCCKEGFFGKNCKPCPGVDKGLNSCFGRGKCHGDGTRGGDGKCKCSKGYVGIYCSNCDANYYPIHQSSTSVECKACHKSCIGGCTTDGPTGCKYCAKGWIMDGDEGCKDVDECLDKDVCIGEHEICVNTEGSFDCTCELGYSMNSKKNCELNFKGIFLNSFQTL